MRPIPPKKPFPAPGKPWHWRMRYFDAGDPITYRSCITHRIRHDKVTKVYVNRFGRVEYHTNRSKFVLIEDVAAAAHGRPFKVGP